MEYRRSLEKGGVYFFTLVTNQRQPILTIENNVQRLRNAFKYEKQKRPFNMEAIVILPDHIHCLWRLPEDDCEYSKRWSAIKRYFSIGCESVTAELTKSRKNKREKAVWQRRFWEHTIKNEADWQRHIDYIHYNPVKHGLVSKVKDWPYSSFRKFVMKGYYSEDWGSLEPENIAGLNFE